MTICNNFVDNYNNTVHSALHGLTPKQITPETQNSFIVRQLRPQLIKRKLKAQLLKRNLKTKSRKSQDLKKKKRKETFFIEKGFFHIFHIFSNFNLPFLHIVHIL